MAPTTAGKAEQTTGSADAGEIARFDALAADWWDPRGKMAPLHAMQPARLDYVREQILGAFGRDPRTPKPFSGLRLLDLGSGGGLMAEPMARLGAEVTGVDASPAAVAAASDHARRAGLSIDYRLSTAEELAAKVAAGEERPFDVVLTMEIVEHVADRPGFLASAARLLAPEGLLIASTLNRTAKSLLLAILGAEYLLRWLPVGTHDWRKFPTPDELAAEMAQAGLSVVDRAGFVFSPLSRTWSVDPGDLSVNYAMTAVSAQAS